MGDQPRKPSRKQRIQEACDQVRLTRRSVSALLLAAFGGGAAAAQPPIVRRRDDVTVPRRDLPIDDFVRPQLTPTTYRVRRPDDMLWLDYRLSNLRIVGSGDDRKVMKVNASRQGYVVVTHQPQHVWEEAFPSTGPALSASTRARTRVSGVSRLVFAMPDGQSEAPWGVEGLLAACRTWPMRLDSNARPAPVFVSPIFLNSQLLTVSQDKLNLASQALLDALPPAQRQALSAGLPEASDRIAERMTDAARRGESLSDQDVDALVGEELSRVLNRAGVEARGQDLTVSRRALEGAASARAIGSLRQLDAITANPGNDAVLAPNENLAIDPGIIQLLAKPRPPADDTTYIELPYRLAQSPLRTAGWSHALAPVQRNTRTEVWHTRLGRRSGDGVIDMARQPLRALWSPDYPKPVPAPNNGPTWPMLSEHRRDIVRLTTGYDEKLNNGANYTPIPSNADVLMLSALGGYLELDGAWPNLPVANGEMGAVNVEAWKHRTATGRDYFVRVDEAGYLYPFGHRATRVTLNERVFESRTDGGRTAVLRQRVFIIVREPVRTYSGARQPFSGRDLPFQQIEVLTKVTPDLAPSGAVNCDTAFPGSQADRRSAFFPVLGSGETFTFRMVGIDGDGRRIAFSAPAMMILRSRNLDPAALVDIANFYNTGNVNQTLEDFDENGPAGGNCNAGARNTVPMNGATIMFAPQTVNGDRDGDTNIPTDSITFKGVAPAGSMSGEDPRFFPAVHAAEVRIPAVKNLIGSNAKPRVGYSQAFKDEGFGGANDQAQLFLDLLEPLADAIGVDPSNPTDAFGGLIGPDLKPSALSRTFGIASGEDNAATFLAGEFDLLDFIPDAKLLGVINLRDVLKLGIQVVANSVEIPKFKTIELPDRVEARLAIDQTPLRSAPPLFEAHSNSRFFLEALVKAERDGVNLLPPEAKVNALLERFQINLFSAIVLNFEKLSFDAKVGEKPKVGVDLHPQHGVLFGGPLEFMNELKKLIPSNGFADPSPIDINLTGITASYSLALPTAQVGICSIQNISLGAGFSLPFTGGAPSARFSFAERHAPFNVTVSMFGGGGFFACVVDAGGMKEIEISLEFGAKIAFDVGVASGGVYAKGGFYFGLKTDAGTQTIIFTGFVELGGHLSVLGLISVSLTFHLSLSYEKVTPGGSRLIGQASLTVEVEVLFFSTSVSIKVERQFAGSPADPLFIDFVPNESVWREYCDAYA